jgi:hypothetical protein
MFLKHYVSHWDVLVSVRFVEHASGRIITSCNSMQFYISVYRFLYILIFQKQCLLYFRPVLNQNLLFILRFIYNLDRKVIIVYYSGSGNSVYNVINILHNINLVYLANLCNIHALYFLVAITLYWILKKIRWKKYQIYAQEEVPRNKTRVCAHTHTLIYAKIQAPHTTYKKINCS